MPSPIPFVLQRDFLCINVNGEQYPVSSSQPTFSALKKALERKQWNRIPKLLSVTKQIADKSHGKVKVTKEGVFYRGNKIENVLTNKILELLEHQKPVAHMLQFMDNLYQQPDMNTVNEIYQWLASGRFALTTDGCFLAYKKVRNDYKDIYSGTIDYHVGQVVVMPRSEVDPNRLETCSRGLHFCSNSYLPNFGDSHASGGSRIMEVKVNPADVVSIPVDYGYAKGRTWRLEVLREVGVHEMIEGHTDTPVMMQPVIEIPDSRPDLIRKVKALPTVKRLIRRGKLTPNSFSKASVERLTGWLRKFSRMDIAPQKSKLFDNPLRFSREAAGLTMGQVRVAAGMTLQEVYNAERCLKPSQEAVDRILTAIASLQGNTDIKRSGVSYPRPASKNQYSQQYSYVN